MGAVFLSASVPVPGRAPFDQDAQPQMIQAAVSALATVALGRKEIVWGGHPAITPMLWAAATSLGVPYASAVHLFQSRFFDDDFPDENRYFANVTYVDSVPGDREASLAKMRAQMLASQPFDAAVFIGGMEGVFDEHALIGTLQPSAACIPIAMTGGASRSLASAMGYQPPATVGPLDFTGLLFRELAISPRQPRIGAAAPPKP